MSADANTPHQFFAVPEQRSLWQDAIEQLTRNRLAIFGAFIASLLLFVAIFGPWLAPYDYAEQNLFRINEPPSRDHWLGTDGLGRDMFTRILYGARTAFLVGLIVTVGTTVLGVVLGLFWARPARFWAAGSISSSCAWPISPWPSPIFFWPPLSASFSGKRCLRPKCS